ncbi:transcriptional regulator domain-containing protein [Acetobacter fabarum]|uniref:transcriptional regulator domain-containing protein n=1 Tax=Acetobacter fabarum TaxID=483199 RepID=UPI0033B273E0
MDTQPDWHDPRFRSHLYHLDAPGLAHELLRQIPAYVTGYQSLGQQLSMLRSIRSRCELAEQFAHHWGLSCAG